MIVVVCWLVARSVVSGRSAREWLPERPKVWVRASLDDWLMQAVWMMVEMQRRQTRADVAGGLRG